MTNHAEISRKLAIAIGWKQVITSGLTDVCYVKFGLEKEWREFDYRDPAVIWPIAKHFDMFPAKTADERWIVDWGRKSEDTPELVVTLAVIGGAG